MFVKKRGWRISQPHFFSQVVNFHKKYSFRATTYRHRQLNHFCYWLNTGDMLQDEYSIGPYLLIGFEYKRQFLLPDQLILRFFLAYFGFAFFRRGSECILKSKYRLDGYQKCLTAH